MKNTVKIIRKYFQKFPEDEKNLKLLKNQTKDCINFFDRKNFTGHVVANALILKENKVLTIFHNKLQMYIQPGGHVDETDPSVIDATIREVEEETGIKDIVLDRWHKKTGIPIFIETHLIPENKKKQEKKHYHYDFMYIFRTKTKNINLQLEEVSGFEWVDIENVLMNTPESFIGRSLKKMFKLDILK
ncbi:MAG: NUDIX domain-containing protein [Patescibacteria group bacterium]|nr:NUDIX domain-containing protein [Patescibacteria group bacterium]